MAFKMNGWSAFTKETEEKVKSAPVLEKDITNDEVVMGPHNKIVGEQEPTHSYTKTKGETKKNSSPKNTIKKDATNLFNTIVNPAVVMGKYIGGKLK